jgi:hypothetical protein
MSSAVVSAEAERVPGWVEKHSDVLLRLGCSHRGAQGERLSDRGIEIADLEVEVHHRALCTVDGRPYRGLVIGRLPGLDPADGTAGPATPYAREHVWRSPAG